MRSGLKMLAIVLCAGMSMTALASDNPVPVFDSEKFLFSRKPTVPASIDRERPQAVNGNFYAVVAPIYSTPPFMSFLRLFNGGAGNASFTVTVVGSGTSNTYGTATYTVPTAATTQIYIVDLLAAANATDRPSADAQVSLYIQSPQALAGYQHVTLHFDARYFENASVCRWTIQDAVRDAQNQMVLPSIHTSRLASQGYPSQVELHNYANAAVTYRFFIRDETSGSLVGQMDFDAAPNASYTIPWSQIESTIGFSPTADQIRANLIVTDPSGAPPAIVLSQSIVNTQLGVTLNMTTMCAVNKPVTNSGGDGGGLPGGGITY